RTAATSPTTTPSSNCSGSPSATSKTSGPANEPPRPASPEANAKPPAASSKAPPPKAGKQPSAPSPSPTPTESPAGSDPPTTSYLHRQVDRLGAHAAGPGAPARRHRHDDHQRDPGRHDRGVPRRPRRP